MRSTFMGLEASKRGLFVQQTALYTTGHNISNANTLGYSRQRVNMQATPGFPTAGLNQPTYPGHLGTGVEAGSIQRIRSEFIDRQYRQETNKLGYWESRTNAIAQMEDVMNEPSEFGLDKAFEQFWKGLEDVGTKPADGASRQVAISRAEHLAESFNYLDKQLKMIQGNIGNELNVSTTQINTILKQIAAVNKQIQEVEPSGHVPNDLYDVRDTLVDKLNEYIPVSIERIPSGGLASEVAEGSLKITFKGADGVVRDLVNGKDFAQFTAMGTNGTKVTGDDITNSFSELQLTGLESLDAHEAGVVTSTQTAIKQQDFEASKGKLLSLINSFGYQSAGGDIKGYYSETLQKLDQLANAFIKEFNAQHAKGYTLEEKDANGNIINASKPGGVFFEGTGAGGIKVNEDILKNPNLLAASANPTEEGNGKNAYELANMQHKLYADIDNASLQSFYQAIVGKVGVDGEEALRLAASSESQLLMVSKSRDSVSAVSLDEEMTNMITFQQAYNANARMITVVDETLDKIINGMGRVGL
ncbi:flagellar hook-associated protein FlgK [Lysinibacillus sphaericus]|uniref:Flagellar hook-associated protein 1 n=3 Tax=Lysinibacillus TaxID=400634 RepID=W7RYW3_LYSSH|nr:MULTISPECIES: flagellar hook-associated protein FlgK [Lysinibacillus]MBE5084760.1 flagellar hook-associated protein FlgK [Bacillus thuringiensis]ACA38761.1 Flagellar hook-associated protein 1 (HAP1) [Lysinibacillus sphaericus C3-41]AMO34983.1 flagellar hook-associated protein FlgK [Lysinibacillus sphaericus]AMR89902.1 flagellar hook-associated protein FlgK [Lysinibacillus sphaericus]ANA47972.1 flagellar hook-associated protein FlgK [Lysinibacillus sphaericus]